MSNRLAIALVVNNIVLAWAIVWLNSGQVNLQARSDTVIELLRGVSVSVSELWYYMGLVIDTIRSSN